VAVVDDNEVCSAVPALRELMDRLDQSDEPDAVYEWAKVNRVLGRLAAVGVESGADGCEGLGEFGVDPDSGHQVEHPGPPHWVS
jgi:hypothetical protein